MEIVILAVTGVLLLIASAALRRSSFALGERTVAGPVRCAAAEAKLDGGTHSAQVLNREPNYDMRTSLRGVETETVSL